MNPKQIKVTPNQFREIITAQRRSVVILDHQDVRPGDYVSIEEYDSEKKQLTAYRIKQRVTEVNEVPGGKVPSVLISFC